MRPRRSPHAFGSQEIGQLREEHLPFLGGVGRRTHDLCCERKRRHREALRPHFGVGGLGTLFPECRFYSQHLPSGQEGGAVAVNVRARLPSPGPSQLSDSSSRRKRHCAGAPSLNLTVALTARMAQFDLVRKCVILANRRRLAQLLRASICPATPDAGHFATYSADQINLHFEHFHCEMPGAASATPHNVCIRSIS